MTNLTSTTGNQPSGDSCLHDDALEALWLVKWSDPDRSRNKPRTSDQEYPSREFVERVHDLVNTNE